MTDAEPGAGKRARAGEGKDKKRDKAHGEEQEDGHDDVPEDEQDEGQEKRRGEDGEDDGPDDELPKWAQRTIFGASLLVLLAMVTYISWAEVEQRNPPDVVAGVERIEGVGADALVFVRIENRGERTAQEVFVDVTLAHPDGEETVGIQASYLGGGERTTHAIRFKNDPHAGTITFTVAYQT